MFEHGGRTQLFSLSMLLKGKQKEERSSSAVDDDDHFFLGNKAVHTSLPQAVLIKNNLNLIWCNIPFVLFIELNYAFAQNLNIAIKTEVIKKYLNKKNILNLLERFWFSYEVVFFRRIDIKTYHKMS